MDGGGVRVDAVDALEEAAGGGAAQVHPRLLTEALVAAAGADVVRGMAEGLARGDGGRVAAVRVAGCADVLCSHVVLAMGPWTPAAPRWFWRDALPPVLATKATSVVLTAELPAAAVFTEYVSKDGVESEPQVYPRPDGTAYVCNGAAAAQLPDDPAAVAVDAADADGLERFARHRDA